MDDTLYEKIKDYDGKVGVKFSQTSFIKR